MRVEAIVKEVGLFTGRLHREHEGKQETWVYDYVDGLMPMLARMAEKRRTGMRGLGYHEA
ncbi:MAG: hypothetical protein JJE30_07895 [Desulfuromonadales bacterium]|nr:hypothetical protein [Desulfuromonadales bacterium]